MSSSRAKGLTKCYVCLKLGCSSVEFWRGCSVSIPEKTTLTKKLIPDLLKRRPSLRIANGRRHVENTFVRPSVLSVRPQVLLSVTWYRTLKHMWEFFMKFGPGFGYKKSNKREFHEYRPSDSHPEQCKCVSTPYFPYFLLRGWNLTWAVST